MSLSDANSDGAPVRIPVEVPPFVDWVSTCRWVWWVTAGAQFALAVYVVWAAGLWPVFSYAMCVAVLLATYPFAVRRAYRDGVHAGIEAGLDAALRLGLEDGHELD